MDRPKYRHPISTNSKAHGSVLAVLAARVARIHDVALARILQLAVRILLKSCRRAVNFLDAEAHGRQAHQFLKNVLNAELPRLA
jgi:hypothetical protein